MRATVVPTTTYQARISGRPSDSEGFWMCDHEHFSKDTAQTCADERLKIWADCKHVWRNIPDDSGQFKLHAIYKVCKKCRIEEVRDHVGYVDPMPCH